MKKITFYFIISCLFLTNTQVFSFNEICDKYLNDDSEKVLKRLQDDPSSEAQFCIGAMYYEGNNIDRDIIEAIKWFKKATNRNYELAQETLQKIFPIVSWKKEVGDLTCALLLVDKSGKEYPNETHIKTNIEKSNYLVLKTGDEFIAAIGVTGCNKYSNDQCNETASIALFGPDWSLIHEAHDVKFEFNKKDFGIINDKGETFYIFMTLNIEPNDPLGQYRLIAVIKDNNKPKVELNQIFWVQD